MSHVRLVTELLRAGRWVTEDASDRIVLSYDERHRRRLRYVASGGTAFLLDLPRATVLRAGDGLRLDDGTLVHVEAAPEPVARITAADTATLMRLAWHIGNRHLPAQLESDEILIREDAVIAQMLIGLGATVQTLLAPFTPEPGAYDPTISGHGRGAHIDHHHHHSGHAHE